MCLRQLRVPVLAAALIWGLAASAQPTVQVPEALEDWRSWALDGHEYRRCPFLYASAASAAEDFVCVWPERLRVDVDVERGEFEQTWTAFGSPQWIPLPGDERLWPRQVEVVESWGARLLEVVARNGAPSVRLPVGRHRVRGVFAWDERPASLPVPARAGVVALSVDSVAIAQPHLADGRLWLGSGPRQEAVEDALEAELFRLIRDDVPTRVETVLRLDVSGRAREVAFDGVLLPRLVPVAVDSLLPTRVDRDGNLRVLARPGQWEVRISARADAVLATVSLPADAAARQALPATEIWSYQRNRRLRDTVAEGLPAVDPQLVGAPWPDVPAFAASPGAGLAIVERRRGQAETRDQLRLQRKLWVDFDGDGKTFVDQFDGVLRASTRLDMAEPYRLLAAAEDGRPLLVTRHGDSVGVEVAGPPVGLRAWGRIESAGAIAASGWRTDLDALAIKLNTPPGTKLLAALGVDNASASLAGRWRLLDFFLVLVVTVAATRLFGPAFGAVALVGLVLSCHEPGAPAWIWLNLLAAVALARAAPPGRLRRFAEGYRAASFLALIVLFLPFAAGQARIAVYPQLESQAGQGPGMSALQYLSGQSENKIASDQAVPGGPQERSADRADAVVSAYPRAPASEFAAENGVRQTGIGIPAWEWTTYELSWSGPVEAAHRIRLLLLPPWATATLRFLAVLALGLLAARFAFEVLGRPWRWPLPTRKGAAAVLAVLLLGPLAERAAGEAPSPALLEELQRRLLRPPDCAPRCAEVVSAAVAVDDATLSIRLQVHGAARVAVPVPANPKGWQPSRILIDNAPAPALRDERGVLWTLVDVGQQEIQLRGPAPLGDALEIPFPAVPRSVSVSADGWSVSGARHGVLAAGALRFARLRPDAAASAPSQWRLARFPQFARVVREFRLHREWHVRTTVERVAPAVGAISLRVPLLAGEAVLSGDVPRPRDGAVAVTLGPAQQREQWLSLLPIQSAMTLTAPAEAPWREVWRFDVDSRWRATFSGLPPSQRDDAESPRQPRFDPRPGESLTIEARQLAGIAGATLAFDEARLSTRVGARARSSSLMLRYRSTHGARHTVRLPPNAALESLAVNGVAQPGALSAGALELPIAPGEHTVLAVWREAAEIGLTARTPAVALGAPTSNLRFTMELPANRWLLFATGPALGPAVLYWSELLALFAIAAILGRIPVTPLKTRHWLLLGLGFSTFSWEALGVVAAWLLAHGARERWIPRLSRLAYNVAQVAFGVLTVVAIAAILAAIPLGLLGAPDMSLANFMAESGGLAWFDDETSDVMARATVWTLPLWVYKVLILAWALWLSFALLRWLPWVWARFSAGGLWRPSERKSKATKSNPPKDDVWDAPPAP